MADGFAVAARFESGGSGISLAPEVHRSACRRLAWVALCYSIGYVLCYGYYLVQVYADQAAPPNLFKNIAAALATLFGIVVYVRTKRCAPSPDKRCEFPTEKLPPIEYANLAVVFQVVAALGIVVTYWGWEHDFGRNLMNAGAALGIESVRLQPDFVDRLGGQNVRLIEFLGVSWVGVWIMFFPLLVPSPPRRATWAAVLTATTVPLVLVASLLVNGIPETARPWIPTYLGNMTVPTYICAIFAIIGSRVVYNLSQKLSRARRMGSYQLVEKIGAGGMGEVWRAEHRMLARPGAIKLIRPEAMGAGSGSPASALLKRFEREAQATAALRSPHTVDLYDFGVTEDGIFYYVMELLDGIDLKTLVEKHGPIPPERASFLLRQVCESLAEAHARGLIHRDVKPSNVFACRYGLEVDFAKVLDFGLVKGTGETEDKKAQLTETGIAAGTPTFMAPEMAYGNRPIDARADLYAVGCVGYWLVTGQLVFDGSSPIEVLLQHINEAPPPPSSRSELEIPCEFERIILDCLQKDPGQRPKSAKELARKFGECDRALGRWSQHRAEKWWELHMPPSDRDVNRHVSGIFDARSRIEATGLLPQPGCPPDDNRCG